MAYPLRWSIVTQTLIRRERWPGRYRTRGIALVYPGQEVQPDQPVIRLEKIEQAPDESHNLANVGSPGNRSSGDLPRLLLPSLKTVPVGAPAASTAYTISNSGTQSNAALFSETGSRSTPAGQSFNT